MKRSPTWTRLLLTAAALLMPLNATADDSPEDLLRVFLDCRTWCYDDFIRSEVTFVDYVRDRTEADFTHTICPPCKNQLYPFLK